MIMDKILFIRSHISSFIVSWCHLHLCNSSHYVLAFHIDLLVLIWYHHPSESYQLSLRTNTYNRHMNKQCLSNIEHADTKKKPQVYQGLTENFPFFYFHLPYFLPSLLLQLPPISKAAFLHNVPFSFLLSSTKIFQFCIQVQISSYLKSLGSS